MRPFSLPQSIISLQGSDNIKNLLLTNLYNFTLDGLVLQTENAGLSCISALKLHSCVKKDIDSIIKVVVINCKQNNFTHPNARHQWLQ